MTNKQRDKYLKRKYDISLVEYKAILNQQGGVCGVCSRKPKRGVNLAVDHVHDVLRRGRRACVNGLVCSYCNRFLIAKNTTISAYAVARFLHIRPARAVLDVR